MALPMLSYSYFTLHLPLEFASCAVYDELVSKSLYAIVWPNLPSPKINLRNPSSGKITCF